MSAQKAVKVGRPIMADGYGIAEGEGELMPWSWVAAQMKQSRNYWIATTRPDGRPHVMPVWGLWLDDTFYFSTGRSSRKGRNLVQDPRVVVHLESGDEVVIMEGRVVEAETAVLPRFADAYEAKYRFRPDPTDPGGVTYALRHRVVLAWLESDFVKTATRWQFEA